MIFYDVHKRVEAFSTTKDDALDFDVILPARQAHSTCVASVPGDCDLDGVDALITDTPGVRIGVRTADCVPILLYDCVRHAAAAVHSGWKGTAANICLAAIDAMHHEYGTQPRHIRAVIGPCIRLDAFEVGDEVHEAFASAGYSDFGSFMANPYTDSGAKWHIDLPGICCHQLRSLGVAEITDCGICTYADYGRLYSYRREGSALADRRIITCIALR